MNTNSSSNLSCTRGRTAALLLVLSLLPRMARAAMLGGLMGASVQACPSVPHEPIFRPSWSQVQREELGFRLLATAPERGSWWTDGYRYYQVKQTGKAVRFEGMTLHEGGFKMQLQPDGDVLRVAGVDLDADPDAFAPNGTPVQHCQLTSEDGKTTVEMLVALDEDGEPIAALQRFDGKELRFETQTMQTLLAGTWNDKEGGKEQWELTADGKLTIKDGPAELSAVADVAYKFETAWHAPQSVVRLPNGQTIGLNRSYRQLTVCPSAFDDDEEQWQDAGEAVSILYRAEDYLDWPTRLPFNLAMLAVCDLNTIEADLRAYQSDMRPISVLSRTLVDRLLAAAAEEEGETEEAPELRPDM